METMLPGNLTLDCVDRLFFHQEISRPDYLPILGSSALEQILSPSISERSSVSSYSSSSSTLSSSSSSSSGFGEMERMSPDSTMEPMLSPNLHSHFHASPLQQQHHQPDSTTQDLTSSYDSDAFDSEDSVSSFIEVQEAKANAANAALLWPKQLHQDVSERRVRRSMSTSSSDSYHSGPAGSLNFSNRPLKAKQTKRKKTKRAEDAVLKCQLCEYSTRFKEHLTSHMQSHDSYRKYMCSDCGQTFKWSHSLKRHQRTHQANPEFQYCCNHCPKTFSRKDHLTIHEDLHRTSSETFPCGQCGQEFKNRKTLTGHMKTHTSQKDFKCDECDSQFTRRASLNRHVRAAHAGQVITCPLCPAVFSYKSTLEDHKKAAHNEGKREFGCQLCGVQFAVKAYLSKHEVTCRNRAVGRSFPCSLCGKSFPTKRHLNEHGKRKHPTIVVAQQQQQQQHQQPQITTTTTVAPKCETLPSMTTPVSMTSLTVDSQKPIYLSSSTKGDYLYLDPSQPDLSLQDPSTQMLQNYVINESANTSMFQGGDVNNGCYLFNNSHLQSRTDVSMLSSQQQQQQQQQQHLNNNNSSHHHLHQQQCNGDEENVGSLLRLVYSCPDPILEHDSGSYSDQYFGQQVLQLQQQQQHGGGHQRTSTSSTLSPENLIDYPMLDGIPLEFM